MYTVLQGTKVSHLVSCNNVYKHGEQWLWTLVLTECDKITVNKGSDWIRLVFAHPFPLNSGAPIAPANFISDGKVQVSSYTLIMDLAQLMGASLFKTNGWAQSNCFSSQTLWWFWAWHDCIQLDPLDAFVNKQAVPVRWWIRKWSICVRQLQSTQDYNTVWGEEIPHMSLSLVLIRVAGIPWDS